MTIADHYRTNDFISLSNGEKKRITAKPTKGPVTLCPGCDGPLALSKWSSAHRIGATFCSITCALKKQAEQRDAGGEH